MKTRNYFSFVLSFAIFSSTLVFSFLLSLEGKTQDYSSNPYSNGGNQYGGDSIEPSINTSTPSSNSPYPSVSSSNINNSNNNYSAPSSSADAPPTKWNKVEQWFQRKTNHPTGQPEMDLANQRINAGKARLKAIKAKDKLDKHLADSNAKTEELRSELEKAEEQAKLIENQVKLQESNQSETTSSDY